MSPEYFLKFSRPLPDAMCLIDAHGQILAANDAASRFFDLDVNSLLDMTLYDLAADSNAKVEQTLRNWSRSSVLIPGPLKVRMGDEKIIPCNCNGSLMQPKSADIPAAILVCFQHRDRFSKSSNALNNKITQLRNEIAVRQKIEQALAKSKAEFEAMFNSIPDAVTFADINRRIVMCSPAVKTLFWLQRRGASRKYDRDVICR